MEWEWRLEDMTFEKLVAMHFWSKPPLEKIGISRKFWNNVNFLKEKKANHQWASMCHSPRAAPIMTTVSAASGQVDLNGKSHHPHIVPVNGGALLSPPNGANNTATNGAGESRGASFMGKYCNSIH